MLNALRPEASAKSGISAGQRARPSIRRVRTASGIGRKTGLQKETKDNEGGGVGSQTTDFTDNTDGEWGTTERRGRKMGLQKETKENEGVGGETTDFTDNTDGEWGTTEGAEDAEGRQVYRRKRRITKGGGGE